MGALVDGKWQNTPLVENNDSGEFKRQASTFDHSISNKDDSVFKAEANRYHIYYSPACPWAHRTIIFRALKGLEDVISISPVEAIINDNGWEFGAADTDSADPLYQKQFLYEIYQLSNATCSSKVTVPVLWDKHKKVIVNNESAEIIRMLNSEFNAYAKNKYDYYPQALRADIDEINTFVYEKINNGVYGCGFSTSQAAYDEAFYALFNGLDTVENILSQQRYLVGNQITEADWRLFTSLIRFDAVYYGHFKCNLKRIADYTNLSKYVRELYQIAGVKETVHMQKIKTHYYASQVSINPSRVVPLGPELDFDGPTRT